MTLTQLRQQFISGETTPSKAIEDLAAAGVKDGTQDLKHTFHTISIPH